MLTMHLKNQITKEQHIPYALLLLQLLSNGIPLNLE